MSLSSKRFYRIAEFNGREYILGLDPSMNRETYPSACGLRGPTLSWPELREYVPMLSFEITPGGIRLDPEQELLRHIEWDDMPLDRATPIGGARGHNMRIVRRRDGVVHFEALSLDQMKASASLWLRVEHYKHSAMHISLDAREDAILLGRHRECDVIFGVPEISRRHAVLTRSVIDGRWYICDVGSSNGVFQCYTRQSYEIIREQRERRHEAIQQMKRERNYVMLPNPFPCRDYSEWSDHGQHLIMQMRPHTHKEHYLDDKEYVRMGPCLLSLYQTGSLPSLDMPPEWTFEEAFGTVRAQIHAGSHDPITRAKALVEAYVALTWWPDKAQEQLIPYLRCSEHYRAVARSCGSTASAAFVRRQTDIPFLLV